MALKQEHLLFGTLCVLAAGYLFLVYPRKPKEFHLYNIETTMTWSHGPNVKLDAKRLKKLNDEIAGLLARDPHGNGIRYSVISLDKKWVEAMYFGDGPMPDHLQEKLDAYIQQRLPDLAREQAGAP